MKIGSRIFVRSEKKFMIKLSPRISSITPSQTIRIDTQAKALIAAGKPVINLSVGELDFETPDAVLTAAHAAVDSKYNHYTPTQGLPSTRQAVQTYLQKKHGLSYDIEDIIITNGAKQAIFNSVQALVGKDDEVLIPAPYWVSYTEQIRFAGGVPVAVDTTDTFQLNMTALKNALTPKTKGIIINYPNNPTGAVYPEADLQTLAEFCIQHDLWIISDEIYECLVYADATPFVSFAKFAPDRTVIVNGVSKSGAMTGWRLGYAAGPRNIINAINAFQSHVTGNVANIVQLTAEEALAVSNSSKDTFLTELEKRRQLVINWSLQQTEIQLVPPDGAFYAFFDITAITNDSEEFCDRLLNTHYVALIPGKFFGKEGYVRLSFANSLHNVETALQRMTECIVSYS